MGNVSLRTSINHFAGVGSGCVEFRSDGRFLLGENAESVVVFVTLELRRYGVSHGSIAGYLQQLEGTFCDLDELVGQVAHDFISVVDPQKLIVCMQQNRHRDNFFVTSRVEYHRPGRWSKLVFDVKEDGVVDYALLSDAMLKDDYENCLVGNGKAVLGVAMRHYRDAKRMRYIKFLDPDYEDGREHVEE